jgi:hypothetical protein
VPSNTSKSREGPDQHGSARLLRLIYVRLREDDATELPADPSELSGLVLTHQIPDDPINGQELARARIPKSCFYLLRPDGHVGLAGTRLEPGALTRYLAERVGLRMATV